MAIPKYVSASEYSKITGLGQEEVKRQCRAGNIPYLMTDGGYYKIPVYEGNVVSLEEFEQVKAELIETKSKLETVKKILEGGN